MLAVLRVPSGLHPAPAATAANTCPRPPRRLPLLSSCLSLATSGSALQRGDLLKQLLLNRVL